jgi:ribosomal protein L11 methyltransferase
MTPRTWLVLGVRSPSGGEDETGLLTEGLLALGGRAVWEERGKLITHLPEPADPDAFVHAAQVELRRITGDPDLTVEASWQPHEEWAETWKRGLAPRRVTERLVVTPSWEIPAALPGDVVVTLDPGMAFGNAEHGTTRGCMRLLDRVITPGERVLDVGSGSGVLAIVAARLGARAVVALEADPVACETARENVERNGVAAHVKVVEAWADAVSLSGLGGFDGVLANIEGSTLHRLLPGLAECARPRGWMILSGVLEPELDGLTRAAASLRLAREDVDRDGEWRSLLLRRRSS